jgi:hypothetical protein
MPFYNKYDLSFVMTLQHYVMMPTTAFSVASSQYLYLFRIEAKVLIRGESLSGRVRKICVFPTSEIGQKIIMEILRWGNPRNLFSSCSLWRKVWREKKDFSPFQLLSAWWAYEEKVGLAIQFGLCSQFRHKNSTLLFFTFDVYNSENLHLYTI